jgi:hypothetical protein
MRARRPLLRAVRADGYRAAVEAALDLAAPGDVVLVMYEKMAPMLALLAEIGAVPADLGRWSSAPSGGPAAGSGTLPGRWSPAPSGGPGDPRGAEPGSAATRRGIRVGID